MKWHRLLIAALLGVFLYSSYQVFTYFYEGYKSESAYDKIRKQYEEQLESEKNKGAVEPVETSQPTNSPEEEPAILHRYQPLLEINQDVVGWISVPDTIIDYPVVQAKDNDFYLRRNIQGEKATAGTIFMDCRSDAQGSGFNTILYGHNMRNGTMFRDLNKYKKKDFFLGNDIIRFDTLYEEIKWEVFSAYVTDTAFYYTKTDFDSEDEYLEFLNTIKEKSMFEKDIELSMDDRILTLSTCSYEYDDARFVVHARRIMED